MSILSRVNKKITKHGDDFLINGATPGKGFFHVMDSGTMHTYFDDTEVAAITRPTLFLVTSSDSTIAVGNTIARDGRTYTVRKIVIQRLGATTIVKLAALT